VREEHRYKNFLRQTIARGKIDFVFLLAEVEIIFFNENREQFRETGATFMVSEKPIIDTFMDKYRTVAFFKERGIAYPRTWLAAEYRDQLGFPLILKKRRGSGGQKLFKINDHDELHFYLQRHRDMIIQEYLPGEDNEYTSGLFSDGETLHTITFKRTLAPGGFSQQVEVINDETVTHFPVQLGRLLDFKGSLNVQFRKTERGCIPFEINPRFSSTVYFRHRFGFQDVLWWLEVLAGRVPDYPSAYGRGIGVKKFSEAVFEE
jgi:carbamoyl-phosphate synthase large subunit